MTRSILCLLAIAVAASAEAQTAAARVTDPTSHGGQIIGPGVANVRIGGLRAAVVGDQAVCPLADGTVPHVGGPIMTGSATVRIGGRPAARVGGLIVETGPSSTIVLGAPTVLIGP